MKLIGTQKPFSVKLTDQTEALVEHAQSSIKKRKEKKERERGREREEYAGNNACNIL